jgi:hypothetical protein
MAVELSAGSKAARSLWGAIVAVTVLASAGTAYAQYEPPTNLDQAIGALDTALKNERGLSEETKHALSQMVGALRNERAEVVASDKLDKMVEEYSKASTAMGKRKAFESVFNNIKIFGDFRFRYEVDLNRDSQPDRYRQRIRFRLGMDWQLTDELVLDTRLTTGDPDDPNTEHQTLGTVFNKYEANWDRLNLTYKPKCIEGSAFTIGKFGNIFYTNPVYGELVWDDDIGADGGAASYTIKGGECSILDHLDFRAMGFDLLESNLTDDVFGLAAQVAATFKFGKCWKTTGAVGYWYWFNPTPGGNTTVLADNAGNVVVDTNGDLVADQFQSDFAILNPIASVTYQRCEHWPITVAAEYIWNTEAHNDRDQGFAVGASIGKNSKKGDWRFDYQYQKVEQDAVFSVVSQDDFLLQTNFEGHLFSVWHNFTDEIYARLWLMVCSRDELGTSATTDSDQDQWRFRIDLNFKF